MPAFKLAPVYEGHLRVTNDLLDVYSGLAGLTPKHKRLVVETLLLRVFGSLEECLEACAWKCICSGEYGDGVQSTPVFAGSNKAHALTLVLSYNRTKAIRYPKWSNVDDIEKNIAKLLLPAEHFRARLTAHKAKFDELRFVRNHIAHGTDGTRAKYKAVLVARYGGVPAKLSPGAFLTSATFTPTIFEQFMGFSRLMLKDLCKV